MRRVFRGLGFNFLFWSVLFLFILVVRFAETNTGVTVLPFEVPRWRILGNGLTLGLLVAVPYTVMEHWVDRANIYSGSLIRIMVIRSLLQLVILAVIFTLVAAGNYYLDTWTGNVASFELSLSNYLFGPMMRFILLGGLLGNIVLSVYRTLQMKIGEDIFNDLLFGRFNPAREEERAFLFLDLRSSTTIAERLGHEKYSYFIQDCFRDLHPAVVSSGAEIYQYVGDEAVLTWTHARAMEDHHCLRAFFLFQEELQKRKDHYEQRYGVVPTFKAGLNLGKVMTAEVGVVKRDIAYHSDVLNTAARVQGLCNEKQALFLVTAPVIEALPKPIPFHLEDRGEVTLRGKGKVVEIFEVTVEGGGMPDKSD